MTAVAAAATAIEKIGESVVRSVWILAEGSLAAESAIHRVAIKYRSNKMKKEVRVYKGDRGRGSRLIYEGLVGSGRIRLCRFRHRLSFLVPGRW